MIVFLRNRLLSGSCPMKIERIWILNSRYRIIKASSLYRILNECLDLVGLLVLDQKVGGN